MTEQEAKTKTCHKTLAPLGGSDGVPSWCSPQACIGSACMAWRWDNPADSPVVPRHPSQAEPNSNGYCGLGGRP